MISTRKTVILQRKEATRGSIQEPRPVHATSLAKAHILNIEKRIEVLVLQRVLARKTQNRIDTQQTFQQIVHVPAMNQRLHREINTKTTVSIYMENKMDNLRKEVLHAQSGGEPSSAAHA